MAVGAMDASPQRLLEQLVDTTDAACIKCGFASPNARHIAKPASSLPRHVVAFI